MDGIDNYIEAAHSVVDNITNSPSGSGFKKASLAAMDYIHRTHHGEKLNEEKRVVINQILTLGTTINDFYDLGVLNTKEYKELRNKFKESAPDKESDFREYRRELSLLEKNRPTPSHLLAQGELRLEPIKRYREEVNRLSLALSFAVAFDKPLAYYYDETEENSNEKDKLLFEGLFNAVMALQVIDDLVGMQGDTAQDRPSFYTAICSDKEIKSRQANFNLDTEAKLYELYSGYLEKAKTYSADGLAPIISAVELVTTTYPALTGLAKRHPSLATIGGVKILTERDRDNL